MLKKRYLFLILIVCLFAVSAVSAEEISNETNIDDINSNVDDVYQFSNPEIEENIFKHDYLSTSDSNILTESNLKPSISKMKPTYYSNMKPTSYSNLVTISQHGNNNQFVDVKINQAFTGTIVIEYNTYDYFTSLSYTPPSKTYFYDYEKPKTYTFNLEEFDSGHISFLVTQEFKNGNRDFIADANCYITRGVSAPSVTKVCGGAERFTVSVVNNDLKPLSDKSVYIYINGQWYLKKTDSSGIASMALNLNPGEYDVIVEQYNNRVFSHVKIMPSIIANNVTKIYKNGTQYYGKFLDSQGNLLKNTDVKFNINGVFYTRTTNDQGIARMNINLNPGTYILTAQNPVSGEPHATTIRVLPNIVENHDLTKYYKNNSQYLVRLLDDTGKPVGSGVNVYFNINGVFYTRSTDANGYAKMNINLGQGTYIITAIYKGLSISNTIKVLPILSANDLRMSYRDGSKFAVKLVDGHGTPFAGKPVTMNINGVFYERVTDNNGVARLNINLQPNTYIVTSSYNGFYIANNVIVNQASNPVVTPSDNNPSGSNGINIDDYDAIILDIYEYDKKVVKYDGNYKIEANVYQNSNTGIDISLSNWKISGTGEYNYVNKNYYTSSIYSNRTGTWQWSDWKVGEGVSGATFHRYSYWTNNFVVKKVAVKIIDGLSEDGYSFYPTCSAMPDVDSHGITREYAIEHNMHYIQGSGDRPGGYVYYYPESDSYH